MRPVPLVIQAFCLLPLSCSERILDDPFELRYDLEVAPKSKVFVSFSSDREAVRFTRYDRIHPGFNEPTYSFTAPVSDSSHLSFSVVLSGATIAGRFSKAEKVPGEGDEPFVTDEVQQYNLSLAYPEDSTTVVYEGHCCGEYELKPVP